MAGQERYQLESSWEGKGTAQVHVDKQWNHAPSKAEVMEEGKRLTAQIRSPFYRNSVQYRLVRYDKTHGTAPKVKLSFTGADMQNPNYQFPPPKHYSILYRQTPEGDVEKLKSYDFLEDQFFTTEDYLQDIQKATAGMSLDPKDTIQVKWFAINPSQELVDSNGMVVSKHTGELRTDPLSQEGTRFRIQADRIQPNYQRAYLLSEFLPTQGGKVQTIRQYTEKPSDRDVEKDMETATQARLDQGKETNHTVGMYFYRLVDYNQAICTLNAKGTPVPDPAVCHWSGSVSRHNQEQHSLYTDGGKVISRKTFQQVRQELKAKAREIPKPSHQEISFAGESSAACQVSTKDMVKQSLSHTPNSHRTKPQELQK